LGQAPRLKCCRLGFLELVFELFEGFLVARLDVQLLLNDLARSQDESLESTCVLFKSLNKLLPVVALDLW